MFTGWNADDDAVAAMDEKNHEVIDWTLVKSLDSLGDDAEQKHVIP